MKIIFKNFCSPAIINIFFVIINTLLAISREDDKGALVQLLLGILLTLLLQVLCMKGMNILSWIIVFLPFIILILYYIFEIPIIYKGNSRKLINEITTDAPSTTTDAPSTTTDAPYTASNSHDKVSHENLPYSWINELTYNKHYHLRMPDKYVDSDSVDHVHKNLPDKWK